MCVCVGGGGGGGGRVLAERFSDLSGGKRIFGNITGEWATGGKVEGQIR